MKKKFGNQKGIEALEYAIMAVLLLGIVFTSFSTLSSTFNSVFTNIQTWANNAITNTGGTQGGGNG